MTTSNADLNWIANYIWGIADDVLRDLYVRGKYRDVILPMTVLRRLDAVLEDTKQAVLDMKAVLDEAGVVEQKTALRAAAGQAFYNTSKFTLRDLRARASRQRLEADFRAWLDGFSPNVQDILESFEFRNQIPRLSKADALGTLVEKLTSRDVNLSPAPVKNADGSVRHPGLDNHGMGSIFEELVRRFNEENNEEAGEHWTPRDAVRLMAKLVFLPVADEIKPATYLLYDGACGTGGMLTVAEETLRQLAAEHGKDVSTHLFGQEINAETYAICKADLLLKGEGDAADNIVGGPEHSTLANDAFPSREFDFMLSNPPYGKSWKTDLERMGGKKAMRDPRFVIEHAGDPEYSLVTRSSDGQMLFLANKLSKMKQDTPLGSRIAEVHNGSSLFTGDAGQGESNIRRWIIENDWLEAIVALPLNMFYNTGIATYVWVLTNRKPEHRQGRVDEIGNEQRSRRFAIIIDEAHSSQGGRTSASMSAALGAAGEEGEDETFEDRINRVMESRKLLPNASYFAFTATPKNKTLEIFGAPDLQPDGAVRHLAFHSYTMKQAIQEGFILDVLAHYTPVASYYRLAKTVEDDPEFDVKKAQKKLRRFVEGHDHAIRLKAEIMVDHFHEQVIARNKIGGAARAMVVTNGIERAIQYFHAIRDYLQARKSPHRPVVAFSGEPEFGGRKVTEASLNGFPSGRIAEKIREDPYRFLVCADKFQTGYDEPLLHTMYVDKTLSGIKAVQTLSRLNRAHPKKHDVFVLDFLNDADTIRDAFADFYRATILAGETDPDKLHDLQADLDAAQIYSPEQVDDLVGRYLGGAERDELDPILDACVAVYVHELDEDAQVDFKGKAKAFVRTYGFLSCVLPYTNAGWEKRSIFLNFLISRLPAPDDEDLSKGILDAIDMDSYRVEKRAVQKILLPDVDAEIEPVPAAGGGHRPEPELDRLSNILRTFNDLFGDIAWQDRDRVGELITKTIPAQVAADAAFRNARQNSDDANARIEHDRVLARIVTGMVKDDAELFKQFMDNEGFKRWMTDRVFELACEQTSVT